MPTCRACAALDRQSPQAVPHAELTLVRKRRHQAVLALFFKCRRCEAELSFLPGPSTDQHGWRMFVDPNSRAAAA